MTVDRKRAYARRVRRRWCLHAQALADPLHRIQDAHRRLDEMRRLAQAEARPCVTVK